MVYNADNMGWIEGGVLNTKHKPFNNIRYRTANSPTNIARRNMLLATTINNQLWRMDWGTIIWMDKHNNNIDTGGGGDDFRTDVSIVLQNVGRYWHQSTS